QLWTAMGIMKSLTLVIVPLFVNRHVNPGVVVSIYTLAFCLVIVTIFEYPIFPDCYIDGQGLTPFKVYAEYVISALLVLGALGWWFIRDRFSPNIRYLLVGALATTVASELIFTLYGRVDGPWNMYGHILNMVAY